MGLDDQRGGISQGWTKEMEAAANKRSRREREGYSPGVLEFALSLSARLPCTVMIQQVMDDVQDLIDSLTKKD